VRDCMAPTVVSSIIQPRPRSGLRRKSRVWDIGRTTNSPIGHVNSTFLGENRATRSLAVNWEDARKSKAYFLKGGGGGRLFTLERGVIHLYERSRVNKLRKGRTFPPPKGDYVVEKEIQFQINLIKTTLIREKDYVSADET